MKVTIAIPCRNAGRWLHACIASALAQTWPDTEVLVWDDGSTDDSATVMRAFGAQIRTWFQPAAGGNHARNGLLAASTGDWVQFLDADDYLEPGKIARQFAEGGDLAGVDVLYSPVWIETWRGDRTVAREASALDAARDLFGQWLAWHLPQTGGALWRREALVGIGGWKAEQPCCQEHELYLRALEHGLRFRFCPSPGAVYRIWSEQTVCRKDPVRVIREKTALIDRLLATLASSGRLTEEHRRIAGQAGFEMARTWARENPRAAAEYFRQRAARALIRARGPAAPWSYRVAAALLGFETTEKLLQRIRRPAAAAPR